MRIVFFGSGAFAVPTLEALIEQHEVALAVTQPDRPAGRHRTLTPTPVAQTAASHHLSIIKPEDPNTPEVIDRIHDERTDAFVVIAYGHKLSERLLDHSFAINLHGSLLPKFRGAAPINWAMIHNEQETGLTVIGLAQRMDAGPIYAQSRTAIDPLETAGELHDRLAVMGPSLVLKALDARARGTLNAIEQDDAQATKAPKLSRVDGRVDFDQPAPLVRARIHGLTPWPGCTVQVAGERIKLCRVRDRDDDFADRAAPPGTLLESGRIACNPGAVEMLEVQPPGKRVMLFADFARGHAIAPGERCVAV